MFFSATSTPRPKSVHVNVSLLLFQRRGSDDNKQFFTVPLPPRQKQEPKERERERERAVRDLASSFSFVRATKQRTRVFSSSASSPSHITQQQQRCVQERVIGSCQHATIILVLYFKVLISSSGSWAVQQGCSRWWAKPPAASEIEEENLLEGEEKEEGEGEEEEEETSSIFATLFFVKERGICSRFSCLFACVVAMLEWCPTISFVIRSVF